MYLTYILVILFLPTADKASSPRKYYSSPNHYFCEITPVGYIKDSKEKLCKGTLYKIDENKDTLIIWSKFLTNDDAPSQVYITNDGKFVVTIGNWNKMAQGDNIIAIFDSTGELIKKYGLNEIAFGNDIVDSTKKTKYENLHWGSNFKFDEDNNILSLKVAKKFSMLKIRSQGNELRIVLKTGNFFIPDSLTMDMITDEDKAEIIKQCLKWAVIDKEIPDQNLLLRQNDTIISLKNIDTCLIPWEEYGLTVMTPEQIQNKADSIGDFVCLSFDTLACEKNKIIVGINNGWVKGENSTHAYLSGGGAVFEFYKYSGKWIKEIRYRWIM